MAVTPMMQQYLNIKAENTDAILFFRLGDFYEMFYDDAKLVSRELNLTLTGKDCGEPERAPMCGIPFHSADTYIARLIKHGHKIVICEQTEDPATAKGLVRREVVRVITPGTVTDHAMLEENQNNYLCAVYRTEEKIGVAFADVSTGEVNATCLGGEYLSDLLLSEIGAFMPREIMLNGDRSAVAAVSEYAEQNHCMLNDFADSYFQDERGKNRIIHAFGKTPQELGIHDDEVTVCLGGLISYINETQKTEDSYLKSFRFYEREQHLSMDYNTRRNLELCETMRQKERRGSLLWVLDHTKSAMGARLLRKWIEMPLMNVRTILHRQNAVQELYDNYMLRQEIADVMRNVLDLERLMTKVIYGSCNAKDLQAIGNTLSVITEVKSLLAEVKGEELVSLRDSMDELTDIRTLLAEAITDEPPFTVREGGMIREGFNADIDKLNDIRKNGTQYLYDIEDRERRETKIKTLKVGYNRVFGYYIEVSRTFIDQVPPHYIRKQTLSTGERYITQELKDLESTMLGTADKISALEYEVLQQIRRQVSDAVKRIQQTASQLALLDVYNALAEVAARNHYVCPEVEQSDVLSIKEGRHPVVEQFVADGYFVPNDTLLDTDRNRLALITGPNMAGKSTYMRQVAIIVIMAQIGSFVPATDARIGLVDRVFTRVGASDDLASGQSTFMLEMTEVAYILNNATKHSLIIYDEIGRGTSTFDGMSIAQAVAEYTVGKKIGAKTLFATHYHELTSLEGTVPGIVNYAIAARKRGDDIIFLRKILRGSADDSYGIEVAKLAGVPNEVLRRAKSVLASLEAKSAAISAADVKEEETQDMISFDDISADEIKHKLQMTDVDSLTPLEALTLVYELKKMAK